MEVERKANIEENMVIGIERVAGYENDLRGYAIGPIGSNRGNDPAEVMKVKTED